MPLTRELLTRLATLDDLAELSNVLGYEARLEELAAPARGRLGLSHPAVRRAAIIGRYQQLDVFGVVALEGRAGADAITEAIAHSSNRPFLVYLLQGDILAAATCVAGAAGKPRSRQLRVQLRAPSPVAVEILGALAPRPAEPFRVFAARAADVLREEGLTSRFFRELARLHAQAAAELRSVPRAASEERRDLALIILTRVLFLYFVQAKGWLAGRNDFLPSLLDTALRRGHSFHRAVYEPLCFGALSAPVGQRTGTARALGDVPFLNGGLFERHPIERRFPDGWLPNECWRQLIDELFQRFHFTLREHEDADAVDPEMLGRVFEGLMRHDRRRSSGTYFTPRDLLRGMVSDALAAALQGRTGCSAASLRVLDPAVGSGAFLLETLHQLDLRAGPVASSREAAARRRQIVRDCLFGVDRDPMAVRLAELRLWLAIVVDDDSTWDAIAPLPNLDRNLRQGDSLLSPFDVARSVRIQPPELLRAVAEQRSEYFAATGQRKQELSGMLQQEERRLAERAASAELALLDARLADVATAGRDLFGQRPYRSRHQQAQVSEWRRRRRELRSVQRRVSDGDALQFFAYDVHFADVLASGGFDVIIGNPPWVRGERISPTDRATLSARYATWRTGGEQGFAHLPDLSVAFVERALELARPGGVIAFLLPAKLLRAGYAGALRAHLRKRASILKLDDRSHAEDSGFDATVFPLVCLLRNKVAEPRECFPVSVSMASGELRGRICVRELPVEPSQPRSAWLALPADVSSELRQLLRSGPTLGSTFRPRLGVKTGANDVFLREAGHAAALPARYARPAVHGRDIAPFVVTPSGALLAVLDDLGTPLRTAPADVQAYLRPHGPVLARRADAEGAAPWALFRTDLLRSPVNVVWRDIASRLEAAVIDRTVPHAPIPLNTCYGVGLSDQDSAHWLVAWLNSTLMRTAAALLAERASGGCFRFSAGTVGLLPLPPADSPALAPLAAFGAAATQQRMWDHDELDRIVAGVFGGRRQFGALLAAGHYLRRSPGGHRGSALSGAERG